MTYTPPTDDMKFALRYLAGFDRVAALPAFADIGLDLADAVIDEAARLAAGVIAPLNHASDLGGATYSAADSTVKTPAGFADAYRALAQGGWTAMEADEAFGGQNMPMTLAALVNEMWQSASLSFALCHLLTQGQIHALQQSATPAQQDIFIPPMVAGRWTGTMNLTEPQAGTDLAAIKTKAVKQDDHYLITGQKIYITYGEHDMAENIIHLVLARTPDAPAGAGGISVFIVPKFLVNADGSLGARNDLRCLSIEKKLGIKASPTAVMQYGGAVGYLVGAENQGLSIMFAMMNHARFAVGLQGLAIAERAYQQAADYAQTRVQGTPLGRSPGTPIAHHPDVLRLLAVMRAEIEAMRGLAVIGGGALDLARHSPADPDHSPETETTQQDERASLLIPIIKGWLTERSITLTSDALQVHGGMGFIEDTGAAQHYRDARILTIYEGTTAIQANDLVFRKTLRDGGASVRALLADMQADMDGLPGLDDRLAAPMRRALATTHQTLDFLCATANDPRRAAVSSVDWLMLLGWLCGGWVMVRSGHVAAATTTDRFSKNFLTTKRITADIYLQQCLPELDRLAQVIMSGGDAILSMPPDWLPRH